MDINYDEISHFVEDIIQTAINGLKNGEIELLKQKHFVSDEDIANINKKYSECNIFSTEYSTFLLTQIVSSAFIRYHDMKFND